MENSFDVGTVLFYIAAVSSALFFIKLCIFSIFGGGTEIEADFSSMTDADTSFGFLSVQSVLAFLMGFGWSGLAVMKYTESVVVVFITAILTGAVFMAVSAYLMSLTKKLNKIVKVDLNELQGSVAKAYTSFAPQGFGQIEVVLNGKLSVIDAKNLSDAEIKSFSSVKVSKIEQNIVYIEQA